MGEKVTGFDEENDRIDPEVRKTVAPRDEAYRASEIEDEEQEYALDPSIKPFPPTDARSDTGREDGQHGKVGRWRRVLAGLGRRESARPAS